MVRFQLGSWNIFFRNLQPPKLNPRDDSNLCFGSCRLQISRAVTLWQSSLMFCERKSTICSWNPVTIVRKKPCSWAKTLCSYHSLFLSFVDKKQLFRKTRPGYKSRNCQQLQLAPDKLTSSLLLRKCTLSQQVAWKSWLSWCKIPWLDTFQQLG